MVESNFINSSPILYCSLIFDAILTSTLLNVVLLRIGTAWVADRHLIDGDSFCIKENTKSGSISLNGSILFICWLVTAKSLICATFPMVDPILTNSVDFGARILPFLNPNSDSVVIVFSTNLLPWISAGLTNKKSPL